MKQRIILLIAVISLFLGQFSHALSQELVVYSARKEHLIKPLFDEYQKQTGVAVKFLTDKAPALLQRLKAEGKNTPADMLITVDAGNLWHAAQENVLQPVESAILQTNIPSHLRDIDSQWFGLSVRARTIVYNTSAVNPAELSSYEELATPKWKNRLLLRTSKKVYNQSLVAMVISEHGEEKASAIIKGWIDNLAANPFSDDTKVLESVAAGLGDVGIVNTYYFGRLMNKNPDLPLALFWPNQETSGTHVNISGAGITKHTKNRDEAVKLLEWLSSENAQNLFADINMEYPVNSKNLPHPTVAAWGLFKQNLTNLTNAGAMQKQAVMLMDKAGYK
nr:extracellular solute-binding protein [Desulfobulbaceae bacterium]